MQRAIFAGSRCGDHLGELYADAHITYTPVPPSCQDCGGWSWEERGACTLYGAAVTAELGVPLLLLLFEEGDDLGVAELRRQLEWAPASTVTQSRVGARRKQQLYPIGSGAEDPFV